MSPVCFSVIRPFFCGEHGLRQQVSDWRPLLSMFGNSRDSPVKHMELPTVRVQVSSQIAQLQVAFKTDLRTVASVRATGGGIGG